MQFKFCEIPINHPAHEWVYQSHMTWVDRSDVYVDNTYQCPGWGLLKNKEKK